MKRLTLISLFFSSILSAQELDRIPFNDTETKLRMENILLKEQILQTQLNQLDAQLPALCTKEFKEMNIDETKFTCDVNSLSFKKK